MYRKRRDWGMIVFEAFIVLFLVALGYATWRSYKVSNAFQAACEAKGGRMYHPYKSDRLCLKSDSLIEVDP